MQRLRHLADVADEMKSFTDEVMKREFRPTEASLTLREAADALAAPVERTQGWPKLLAEIIAALECRGGYGHYCPNCDNGLYGLLTICRAALPAAPGDGTKENR